MFPLQSSVLYLQLKHLTQKIIWLSNLTKIKQRNCKSILNTTRIFFGFCEVCVAPKAIKPPNKTPAINDGKLPKKILTNTLAACKTFFVRIRVV